VIALGVDGGAAHVPPPSVVQAGQYAVTVDAEVADQARQLLTRLTWQTNVTP